MCAENSRWFVSLNFAGSMGGCEFFGLSQIVDPLGRVVATTGETDAGMAIATVDIKAGIAEANSQLFGSRLIRTAAPRRTRR